MADHVLYHLAELRLKLIAAGADPATIPLYMSLYYKARDGLIPAERVNGRWHFAEGDVPVIAEKLGIALAAAPAAPKPRRAGAGGRALDHAAA